MKKKAYTPFILPYPAADEDFAKWLAEEVDSKVATFLQQLINDGAAKWICDPEVENVFGIQATPGREILLVMYDRGRDFETSAELDRMMER